MTHHDPFSFDHELAEHLLEAAASARSARRLAERLALTTVPARASEFAGEEQAVVAFRAAAALTSTIQDRRPSMIKATVAKLLTLKAAAILAGMSAGGVALAATTGVLPNPLSQDPPRPTHSATAPANPDAGTPSPSMLGLCTAYLAGAGSEHGKALESPAFQALITAAGDADSVDAYCATVVVSRTGGASPDHPTGPPATHPGGGPETGRPTPHSTNASIPAVTPSHS